MNTTPVYFTGIDIGSTASKTVVLKEGKIEDYFVLPTGWNGRETANAILEQLKSRGYADDMRCVATGYGRICVDYADKIVTEITCHGKGGWAIFKKNMTIIDVGGQDTKMIKVVDGQVADFLMNDKCAAGTGKFIEVMATRLGADLNEMYELAAKGQPLAISAMCTVFAESEVVSLIAQNQKLSATSAPVRNVKISRPVSFTPLPTGLPIWQHASVLKKILFSPAVSVKVLILFRHFPTNSNTRLKPTHLPDMPVLWVPH